MLFFFKGKTTGLPSGFIALDHLAIKFTTNAASPGRGGRRIAHGVSRGTLHIQSLQPSKRATRLIFLSAAPSGAGVYIMTLPLAYARG